MERPGNSNEPAKKNVIIEMRPSMDFAMETATVIEKQFPSFTIDKDFFAVPVNPVSELIEGMSFIAGQENYLLKATVSAEDIPLIEARKDVVKIWDDTPIDAFPCAIPPCDCKPSTPRGNISDVAQYLGVDKIWASGNKGAGIVVAVVDGGITANGRTISGSETSNRIDNVIDGYPSDWGTTARNWSEHGNMCATDVAGMAPDAKLMDIRISGAAGSLGNTQSLISNAIAGYQWCIIKHRSNGTPHILTNSWGIFQSAWDPVYASDPLHPFTRKVEEALNEGIIILFAAGNCGDSCADNRCGSDQGPGKSIWGANGHPRVMTVGAVNKNEEFVGYSSQGPATLDPHKPDFCSITHFTGYFNSDSGTSAATPIAAGVVALFKQAKPKLTQDEVKKVLITTAKDIGPVGWDQHSGAGIIQGKAAYDALP